MTDFSSITVENSLPIPLLVFQYSGDTPIGNFPIYKPVAVTTLLKQPLTWILPNSKVCILNVQEGKRVLFTTTFSGAKVYEWNEPCEQGLHIDNYLLNPPNYSISLPPEPTKEVPIPPDTPRTVVGCGPWAYNSMFGCIVREQYWRRGSDSFSLGAGETRTVQLSYTFGIEETSSTIKQFSSTLGMSSSMGWDSFALGFNASMSSSITMEHSFSISKTWYSCSTETYKNTSEETEIVLKWQLMDVMTVLQVEQNFLYIPKAVVSVGQSPILTKTTDNVWKLERVSP